MTSRAKARGAAGAHRAEVRNPRARKKQAVAGTRREHAVSAMPPKTDSLLRHRMISEAAYLLAMERGFAPGGELDDWLQAEAQINARLGEVTL